MQDSRAIITTFTRTVRPRAEHLLTFAIAPGPAVRVNNVSVWLRGFACPPIQNKEGAMDPRQTAIDT